MWNLFRPPVLPFFARAGFRREYQHFLLMGLVVGGIEGAVLAAVAKKTFDAPDWLTSIVLGLPVSANILNPLWAALLEGRALRPAYLALAGAVMALAAAIALVPATGGLAPALTFAGLVAVIHVFMSGLLTIRAELWRANYPTDYRAQATSQLMALRGVLMLAGGLAISAAFEWDPGLYRVVFPAIAAAGLVALRPMAGIRVRHERERLRLARRSGAGVLWGMREAVVVLRDDARFARYQTGQFLLGSANFFTDAALINIVLVQLDLGYVGSQLMMVIIPSTLALACVRLWAQHFDAVGVVRFRLVNTLLWGVSYGLTAAAILLLGLAPGIVVLALLVAARGVNGVCRGGGQLAWNLGHLHFSAPDRAQVYMGIHVALTGVRGLLMPAVAAVAVAWVGAWAFVVPVVLCVLAYRVFHELNRQAPEPQMAPQAS